MGYITLIVLSLTVAILAGGILFGMLRGFNRSVLRLVLVAISVGLAFLLREPFVKILMNIRAGDGTLKDKIMALFGQGGEGMPESMQNLVFALVELIIGLLAFGGVFYALRYLTWLVAYPILKIWIKQGNKKRSGLGALVGLVQGALIAIVIIAPVSGMLVQVNKLSQLEVDDKKLITLPAEMGLDEYVNSSIGAVYNTSGGWLFDALTTGKTASKQKVSISDTCDVIVAFGGLTDTVEDLSESFERMASDTVTPAERIDAMKTAGEKLTQMGETIDGLGDTAKTMINEILASVKDMVSEGEEMPEEVESVFNNLTVDSLNLASVGRAITGIGSYIEKTEEGFENYEPVTIGEVEDIVNGIAENPLVLNLFRQSEVSLTLVYPDYEHEYMFQAAIESTELSYEDKNMLFTLFGVNG